MLMMGQLMTVHYEDDVSISPHDIVSQGHFQNVFKEIANMQSREKERTRIVHVCQREREREPVC